MTAPQLTEAEFKALSPQQMVHAYLMGQLAAILAGEDPAAPPTWPAGQMTEEELKTLNPAAIVEAYQTGRLNALLGRPVPAPEQG